MNTLLFFEKRKRGVFMYGFKRKFILFLIEVLLIAVGLCVILHMNNRTKQEEMAEITMKRVFETLQKNGGSDFAQNEMDTNDMLILVNSSHPLNAAYGSGLKLTQLRNNQSVDERCYPYLQQMMDDCRAEGLSPIICSSFRSYRRQRELFDKQVCFYISRGYSESLAEEKAATSVAVPGTSEHETGLAVDIVDENNQKLDESQERTAVQKWLIKNSWRYGFILRYPPGSSKVTGIIYEPWHYRFVGQEAAKEIYERKITLEEYLEDKQYK